MDIHENQITVTLNTDENSVGKDRVDVRMLIEPNRNGITAKYFKRKLQVSYITAYAQVFNAYWDGGVPTVSLMIGVDLGFIPYQGFVNGYSNPDPDGDPENEEDSFDLGEVTDFSSPLIVPLPNAAYGPHIIHVEVTGNSPDPTIILPNYTLDTPMFVIPEEPVE